MSAFKAYDFRGKFNVDFTVDTVYKIGFFLPKLLKTNKVLLGCDMRVSTPALYQALTAGITDAGADVYDMGLCTTPMVYFFTAKHNFDASVMITASHNPKEYNGLKISRTGALPVGYNTGLEELEKMVNNNSEDDFKSSSELTAPRKGQIIPHPVKDEYLDFLAQYKYDISNLNIAMDCSNGMASILARDIFGDQPHYIYDTLDGTFPNHEANPLEMKNVKDLQKLVKEIRADVGVIFDGDADRVMFVDENGNFIPPDLMIAMMSYYFIGEKDVKGKVIVDIRTSKSVSEFIEKQGREVYTWKVGRAFAAMKLREIDGAFGGEFAGHYYFRDFFYSDSAMMAALILLHVISQKKREGISLSELISQIMVYANSGEINFKIENKAGVMKAVTEHFTSKEKPTKVMDFDGYRIEFKDWWFNIRPSNTEPYLRLLMEAKTEKLLAEKLEEAEDIIKKFAQ